MTHNEWNSSISDKMWQIKKSMPTPWHKEIQTKINFTLFFGVIAWRDSLGALVPFPTQFVYVLPQFCLCPASLLVCVTPVNATSFLTYFNLSWLITLSIVQKFEKYFIGCMSGLPLSTFSTFLPISSPKMANSIFLAVKWSRIDFSDDQCVFRLHCH